MNPWNDLQRQSAALESWQLLMLLLFVLGYLGCIGRLLGDRGRLRSAGLALVSGAGLCLLVAPWVLGALMLAAAIGTIGLFTALVMLLSRVLGVDRRSAAVAAPPALDDLAATPRHAGVRAADPLTVT